MIFSTTIEDLQRKLDELFNWCKLNFVSVNAKKTECLVFNVTRRVREPTFTMYGKRLTIVYRHTYVGVMFTVRRTTLFEAHLDIHAKKARCPYKVPSLLQER